MKKTFLFIVALMATVSMSAKVDENAVLMTVNGEPSTVGEFLYIYQKNNQDAQVDQKSIDEYVELFTNFKLKVAAAKEAGIDTTEAFRKELEGYRKQATPKYMTDPESENAVVEKAYHRMLTDRKVSHIAVRCPDVSRGDTEVVTARKKIEQIRLRVTEGKTVWMKKGKVVKKATKGAKEVKLPPEDFNEVALEVSDDPSVADNKGLIGWVRPFRFVFPFEEAVYNTEVGEISEVFATPFGFHILKVEEEIPHKEVQAAHIMKMTPRGDEAAEAKAKHDIDSIYQLLLAGADFAQTAIQNSDDRGSAMRGGELGFFSRGQMVPEFENTAFSMTEPGELSEPFKSQYGWHIIKRGETRGMQPLAKIHDEILKNVNRSEYRQLVNEGYVQKLAKDYGVEEFPEALQKIKEVAASCGGTDSAFLAITSEMKEPLCVIGGKQYVQSDLISYIQENPFATRQEPASFLQEKYNMFKEKHLRALEDANLENKYPELKNLMTEYHDGILLFEVSLKEVWDKATQDTAGIIEFFNANKKNYTWDSPRYKGYMVYAKDKKMAKAAKQIIKTANPDSINSYINNRLNTDSIKNVRIEKGLFKKGDNKGVDRLVFKVKDGAASEELPVEFVVGKKLKAPQDYTDERGRVTSDYQDYLEKQWVKRLREKYPVVINKEVLEEVKKEQ